MTSSSSSDWDLGPTSHSFLSQRLRLNYLDWGNSGAPILILLHGGRDHARNWDWVARALRDDYHVICPDLRGHGDSAWSPDGAYTLPFFVIDLAQLIHQLGQNVSIAAHSLGGAIALRYTGAFPETVSRVAAIEGIGLPLRNKAGGLADRFRSFVDKRRAVSSRVPRRYATIEEATLRMQAANTHLSPTQARHLTLHGVTRNEDGTFSWKFDNYLHVVYPLDMDDDEVRELWRRIDCPTWLVHGADSWAQHPDTDGRSAEFRDVQVTSYAGAGHWVQHDRCDDFITDLRGFLNGEALPRTR